MKSLTQKRFLVRVVYTVNGVYDEHMELSLVAASASMALLKGLSQLPESCDSRNLRVHVSQQSMIGDVADETREAN
jgi:hypothetical protein